mgnify:CR=1 FL=1
MVSAGTDIKTPLPRNGKRNAIGIASVLGIAVAAISVLAFFGVPTPASVQTKEAATKVTDKIENDVTGVAVKLEAQGARIGKLETDTAVLAEQGRSVIKALDRFDRVIEAQTANIETLMRSVEIPERNIKKAKER